MESFAKLADSIYFKSTPEEPPPPVARPADASGPGAGSGAHPNGTSQGGPPPELLPQLFVNQLVSSSVRWRELRVVVHQQAGEGAGPAPLRPVATCQRFMAPARKGRGERWRLVMACAARAERWCQKCGSLRTQKPGHGLSVLGPQPIPQHTPSTARLAELYGPETAAVSRLTLEIYPPDVRAAAADGAAPEQRRFALNWRIPGWGCCGCCWLLLTTMSRCPATLLCCQGGMQRRRAQLMV